MPGENGLQLAARLKAMWPETIVVIFSAMDVAAEALASGSVDRFVRKGDMRYLRDALEELNEQLGNRGEP
jgi:CheY-like chemotaxis protein